MSVWRIARRLGPSASVRLALSQVKPWFPIAVFVGLWLLSTRVFLFRNFSMIGHNWDWSFPALQSLYQNFDVVSRYTWNPSELGFPAYFTIVHLVPNTLVKLMAFLLPAKWLIYTILLAVVSAAFFGFKRLVGTLAQRSWHTYIPALLYAFSPFLWSDIIGGSWVMWISYAAFPWAFYFGWSFLRHPHVLSLFGAAVSTTFVLASTQNTILFLIFFLFWVVLNLTRREIRLWPVVGRTAILIGVLTILNLYWLVVVTNGLTDIVRDVVLNEEKAGTIDSVAYSHQSLFHILALSGYLNRNLYWYVLPDFLRVAFVLAAGAAWLGIGWYAWRGRRPQIIPALFWLTLLAGMVLLVKGGNRPWGALTVWLYEAMPFLRLYRSPQHLMLIPAFIVPILLGFAWCGDTAATRWRRAVPWAALVAVILWVSGWWYTGDFGHAVLSAQKRDHVDYYSLSPESARTYERHSEAAEQEQRILFAPAVVSPLYVADAYQGTAQGGIPEYTYLRQPTFTSESNVFAQLFDQALCQEQDAHFPFGRFLALFNVGEIILRNDILPWHTACRDKWRPAEAASRLDRSDDLELAGAAGTVRTYRVKPSLFTPRMYTPSALEVTDGTPKDLPALAERLSAPAQTAFVMNDRRDSLPEEVLAGARLMRERAVVAHDRPVATLSMPKNIGPTRVGLQRDSAASDTIEVNYFPERGVLRFSPVDPPLVINGETVGIVPFMELEAQVGDIAEIGESVLVVQEELQEKIPYATTARVWHPREEVGRDSLDTAAAEDRFFNCSSGGEAGDGSRQQFVADGIEGEAALELHTDGKYTACWRHTLPFSLQEGTAYSVALAVNGLAGEEARIHVDARHREQNNREVNRTVPLRKQQWQRVVGVLPVSVTTGHSTLYLYAVESQKGPVTVRFDDLVVSRLEPVQTARLVWPAQPLPTADHTGYELAAAEAVSRDNLIPDASFARGLWQEEPTDCHTGQTGRSAFVRMESIEGVIGSQPALRLTAHDGHSACIAKNFDVSLDPAWLYRLSFLYRTPSDDWGQFYYHGAAGDTGQARLEPSPGTWRRHEAIVALSRPTDTFQVFLYASSERYGSATVDYDAVELVPWVPAAAARYRLVSDPVDPSIIEAPSRLSLHAVNPTKYVVRVEDARRFPLVFSESFHRGWKLYPRRSRSLSANELTDSPFWETWFARPAAERQHFAANGYANAWWVDLDAWCRQGLLCKRDANARYTTEFVLEFWPQRLLTAGLGVSGTAWLGLGGLAAWAYSWRRTRWYGRKWSWLLVLGVGVAVGWFGGMISGLAAALGLAGLLFVAARRWLAVATVASLGATFILAALQRITLTDLFAVISYYLLGVTLLARWFDSWPKRQQ